MLIACFECMASPAGKILRKELRERARKEITAAPTPVQLKAKM